MPAPQGAQGGSNAFQGALTKQTADQTIPDDGSWHTVNLDAENYDTDGFHDNAANNSRLTIPAGVSRVQLFALIGFKTNATGGRAMRTIKNGSIFDGRIGTQVPAISGIFSVFSGVSGVLEVSEGDYFELQVFQNSGGDLDIDSGHTAFGIHAIN